MRSTESSSDRRTRPGVMAIASWGLLSLVLLLLPHAGLALVIHLGKSRFLYVRPDTPAELKALQREREIMAGGLNHKRLRMICDYPGVDLPTLWDADQVDASDSAAVVGVKVNHESCAFLLESMRHPKRHIVNLMLGGKPVSVTYCGIVDRVRVVKGSGRTPNPLHVGGLDVDNQMVLLLGGQRYGQDSAQLPLRDHPFTRTSLGDWKTRHPGTRIYAGTPWDI